MFAAVYLRHELLRDPWLGSKQSQAMLVYEDLGRTILMNAMNAINATDAMNAATAGTIEGTEQVRWDLSILYSGIDDPRLDSDLKALDAMAKRFAGSYKGKLAERLVRPSATIRKSRCCRAKSHRIYP